MSAWDPGEDQRVITGKTRTASKKLIVAITIEIPQQYMITVSQI